MDLTLTRTDFREDGIFGELSNTASGARLACTLEHAYPVNMSLTVEKAWEPKIPAGVYTAKRYMSPKHGYEVFRLLSVPGSDYDEIHIGNYNKDSDGCILVGFQVVKPEAVDVWMSKYNQGAFEWSALLWEEEREPTMAGELPWNSWKLEAALREHHETPDRSR